MRSEPLSVFTLFKPSRQFRVPFYQRTYTWKQDEQWEPLWDDIRAKAEGRLAGQKGTPHFLGAVVIQPHEAESINSLPAFDIIDGQQRLTTLQYVLAGLRIAHRELGLAVPARVEASLANQGSEDEPIGPEDCYKVWPTFTDRVQHLKTMDALSRDELRAAYPQHFTRVGSLRVHDATRPPSLGAVWFFSHEFVEWIRAEGRDPANAGAALAEAVLSDLQLISLRLEAHDDPQVIFETLNGRGARLSAIDLIRNLIFMRADGEQGSDPKSLYEKHWLPFESKDWTQMERRGRLLKPRLEWMVRSMLEATTQQEIDHHRLYNDYKAFAIGGLEVRPAEDQLGLLAQFGEHYTALVSGTGSLPIARFGRRIRAYEATTVYPLGLLISTSDLEDADKSIMYRDLLSYVVRRAVCGLTSKNYNSHFMAGLKHVAREGVSPDVLRGFLAGSRGEATRWPRDGEFRKALQEAALYYGRLETPKARQLLTEIEGELRRVQRTEEPEIPSLANLDIDHIMPRQWTNHWLLAQGSKVSALDLQNAHNAARAGLDLTEVQKHIIDREGVVHALGNLTLLNLSVNRTAQDKGFTHKRDMLIRHTNLSLNVQLLDLTEWTVETIRARGVRLADAALRLYPGLVEEATPVTKVVSNALGASVA